MGRHRPNNRFEIRGLEARATDQRAADFWHRKDRARACWVHGAAVENPNLPALGSPTRDKTLTQMRVHLRDLLESRGVTSFE
jgi:hypothetical protein